MAKPEGWFMLTGDALRERVEEEAQRLGTPSVGSPPEGAPNQLLARITRYAPGSAPGPNPTIVVTRFDVQRLPPGTTESDLLRMGTSSASVASSPTRVAFGGRGWQKLTAMREVSRPDGVSMEAMQEIYVTLDQDWALGVVISATRRQFVEYRAAFDAVLSSITFK